MQLHVDLPGLMCQDAIFNKQALPVSELDLLLVLFCMSFDREVATLVLREDSFAVSSLGTGQSRCAAWMLASTRLMPCATDFNRVFLSPCLRLDHIWTHSLKAVRCSLNEILSNLIRHSRAVEVLEGDFPTRVPDACICAPRLVIWSVN